MTAKETIRAKLFKLRLRARQTGQVRLPASAVALWTQAGIHFLLAAVLSGAVLLGDCAPEWLLWGRPAPDCGGWPPWRGPVWARCVCWS